jgi:hypothetical protein
MAMAHTALATAFYLLHTAVENGVIGTNLESVFNGAMNILSPECCYFPLNEGGLVCSIQNVSIVLSTKLYRPCSVLTMAL